MLEQIEVKSLFGLFDYSVKFKNGVNILIGPNGCGKSTLLRAMVGKKKLDNFWITKDMAEIELYTGFEPVNLNCFDSLHFLNLMNESFINKVFNADGTITQNGEYLSFDDLSSGEKHWFRMFAFLHTHHNCTVCIDEPESHLHIELQERFIEQVSYICEHNNLQVIIATHSPNIISDHLDLIVGLDNLALDKSI